MTRIHAEPVVSTDIISIKFHWSYLNLLLIDCEMGTRYIVSELFIGDHLLIIHDKEVLSK